MKALRDTALTALVSALLFVPLAGMRIDEQASPPVLVYHWGRAALLIALAILGQMLLTFGPARRRWKTLSVPRIAGRLRPNGPSRRMGAVLVLLISFGFLLLPFAGRQAVDLVTLILVYAMLGAGLNIVVGFTGLLDLGFIGFFAVGAYCYALLSTGYNVSFWQCLPLAALLPAAISLLLGFAVLRLRGDYFAIVTLGFGQIVYTLLVNGQSLTHGSQGISEIPHPTLFGFATFARAPEHGLPTVSGLLGIAYSPVQRVIFLYYLILGLALLANLLSARLRRLPLGRAWEAVREDEVAAAAIGISRGRVKMAAYALSAGIAGVAGAFFAARQGFISPESFTFMDSAIVLAIVVLGGMGSQFGVIVAAFLLIGTPEVIRGMADYRMLIFGAAMVLLMLVRPKGLIATRRPSVTLK